MVRRTRKYWFFVFVLFVWSSVEVAAKDKFSVKVLKCGQRIPYTNNEILLEFSNEIDEDSLTGNIDFRNTEGSLQGNYTVQMYPGDNRGQTVWLRFLENFHLNESSKYYVDINKGVRYVKKVSKKGKKRYGTVKKTITIFFVTTSQCPFSMNTSADTASRSDSARTKIVIISDVHIGDSRATKYGYNWFGDNKTEFISFLDDVLKSDKIKELVIAGDMFDEWIMPVDVTPFIGEVTNSEEFFYSVANAPAMQEVISKMNEIAESKVMKLKYVPGNHDMLMSEKALKLIFPHAVWEGKSDANGAITGTGIYWPEDDVVIEHGHIYDFFNAPDPYSQPGSLLPPGYFISRMYATSMLGIKQEESMKTGFFGNAFFYTAWELALLKVFGTLWPDIPAIITGIDGYTDSYTYAQTRDHYYNADIAGYWKQRQETNGVYIPEGEVSGMLVGAGIFIWGKLQEAAKEQYLSPNRAKIVVYGHTHMAMLKGYNKYTKEIVMNSTGPLKAEEVGPGNKDICEYRNLGQ